MRIKAGYVISIDII